jgi:hypothetical protein
VSISNVQPVAACVTPEICVAWNHATYTKPASAITEPVNVYRKNLTEAFLRLVEPHKLIMMNMGISVNSKQM